GRTSEGETVEARLNQGLAVRLPERPGFTWAIEPTTAKRMGLREANYEPPGDGPARREFFFTPRNPGAFEIDFFLAQAFNPAPVSETFQPRGVGKPRRGHDDPSDGPRRARGKPPGDCTRAEPQPASEAAPRQCRWWACFAFIGMALDLWNRWAAKKRTSTSPGGRRSARWTAIWSGWSSSPGAVEPRAGCSRFSSAAAKARWAPISSAEKTRMSSRGSPLCAGRTAFRPPSWPKRATW